MEIDKIYNGDCLELLTDIPDKSANLILIDPPFGLTAPKWDQTVPFDKLWKEFGRIITDEGVIASFAAQPFTTKLIASNIDEYKYCWYWLKNQATNFLHAKRMPMRKIEEICIFGGKTYYPQLTDGHVPTNSAKGRSYGKTYHGTNTRDYEGGSTQRMPNNILEFKCVNNYARLHSAQKPVDLLEYLIKTYTKEYDLVLDCFAGSGSTLVAAKNLNRNWIGIEKDEKIFQIAQKRIDFLLNLPNSLIQ